MPFFLYILNITLLARIIVFRGDAPAPWYRVLIAGIAQAAAAWLLIADLGAPLWTLISAYIALAVAVEYLPRCRVISRLSLLVLFALVAAHLITLHQPQWRSWLGDIRDWVRASLVFGKVARADWTRALIRISGLLLCFDESNMLVRVVLSAAGIRIPGTAPRMEPVPDATATDQHNQLVRSAVIGNLERVLVFIFVLHGAFNAVPFIITAKGIVRFHELVKPEWAAYVLIGTLLSTLAAIGLGLAALQLLS